MTFFRRRMRSRPCKYPSHPLIDCCVKALNPDSSNALGILFGPLATGLLSDLFRGRLLAGGTSDLQATAQGLVWALRVLIAINVWAALHFVLAARTLRQETPA